MGKRELNILFTYADRRVDLLDAFRDAMGQLGVTGKLIAADTSIASAALHRADASAIVPHPDEATYIPVLLDLVKEHNVGLLVPLSDLDLVLLAGEHGRFSEVGCTVMTGSYSSVALCRDDARFERLCEQTRVANVKTLSLADFESRPFFPCLVKPARKPAHTKPRLIRSRKQLLAYIALCAEPILVRECASGWSLHIDVYRSRDGVVRCVVPRQELAARASSVEIAVASTDGALIAEVTRLVESLGDIWGVLCCHCIRGEDGSVTFLGVDPRFGDGVHLSIAAGANLPAYLLEEVLGLPSTANAASVTDGMLMLRYDNAVFVQVDDRSSLPGCDTPIFE